ncbi:relaxase MobL [Spiroplasma taiwanense]|nr:relaxase MobL [Spiroplasma taiwanense]
MNWFFSFHNNTDNPHIHLAFFEKKATYPKKYSKTEFNYRYKYNLDKGTQAEINKNGSINLEYDRKSDFKLNLEKEIKLNSLNLKINNEIRDNLIFHFKDNINWHAMKQNINSWNTDQLIYNEIRNNYHDIVDKILDFNQKIKMKTNKFQNRLFYNSKDNSKSFKTMIDKLTNFLIEQSPELKYVFDEYITEINQYQEGLNQINETNSEDYVHNALYGNDGLYSRLGNHILKTIYKLKSAEENLSLFSDQLDKQKMSIIEKLLYMIKGFLYKEYHLTKKMRERTWMIVNQREKKRKE